MNGAVMEKQRAWTARGEITPEDKRVIRSIADRDEKAARIFVTGEAHECYLGEEAVKLLENINDVYYKYGMGLTPLFVATREDTVRMLRFEPREVWGCFHPDLLVKLIEEEAKRLHVDIDPWGVDEFDFYQEMARVIRLKIDDGLPIAWKDSGIDDYYNAVYLSCLLLFNKPGYLDVPVATYFAQPKVAEWMAHVDYRKLTAPEIAKYMELESLYGNIPALTNPELHFIVDLLQRSKDGSSSAPNFKADSGL